MADANLRRRNLSVRGLAALDLCTLQADGTPWNFSLKKDRREASRLIDERDPMACGFAAMHSIIPVERAHELPQNGSRGNQTKDRGGCGALGVSCEVVPEAI